MTDTRALDSTMDGAPYRAGHHAATLRRILWREHLGLLPALRQRKDFLLPQQQPAR